ncbi:Lrp/AsnC family transcriptional regulator [Streptosporangium fragile]|uniref:Lrp/AsnC family transcriptional regulator n=2 Tax=Streptosporangium fragile TaxID=46186 RepID=A0ABP6IMX9_9ACTN
MQNAHTYRLDPLDARILLALDTDPELSVLGLSRKLGVSRNTIGARMQKMAAGQALAAPTTRVLPDALGHPLLAFVAMALRQPARTRAYDALKAIPNVLEIHATSGDFDLLLRVVAQDTDDLYRVTNLLLDIEGVERTSTMISMHCEAPYRMRPLIEQLLRAG